MSIVGPLGAAVELPLANANPAAAIAATETTLVSRLVREGVIGTSLSRCGARRVSRMLHASGAPPGREDAWFDARVHLSDVRRTSTLGPADREAVRSLQAHAADADGVAPLSEQTMLSLTSTSGRVQHIVAYAAGRLLGYAQLGDGSAEVVVDPAARRHGTGRALLDAVLGLDPGARVWAHGNLPAAQALAGSSGLGAVRELHKMARPLTAADTAAVTLPDGFHSRAFEPGRDEQAWLETNAAAFAEHAEQGRMTLADLQERMGQAWFDPAGFILVEADDAPGRVAAFHWTKVDPEQRSSLDPARPAGEVYVVGVHPAYQGRGLGRPVTALGLAHLAGLGLPEVVLYVDGDNTAALRTYTGLGFSSIMVDVMYSRTARPVLSG
jgi:mycothiol synthase